tara:strand:+ start:738 stop:992 length:255 start_codon:yes stop_codon:yes gene_type:complete
MITNLKRKTIQEEMIKCASLGYGTNTKNPAEWLFKVVGYSGAALANLATLNISAAGKDLNKKMGYDFIKETFPFWAEHSDYSAT